MSMEKKDKIEVPKKFNEAENYENISSIEREDGLNLIELVGVAKGSKVLDLGCGIGYHAKVLADLVGEEGKVIAVDPDKKRIAVAMRKYKADNLDFLEGCAESLPGEEYDLIFSNHVLHWCKDRSTAFTSIAKSLKPGGKLACNYVINHRYNDDRYDFLSKEHQDILRANLPKLVDEDECNVLVEEHGFSELYRSKHECMHTFKDPQEYIDFILTHLKSEKIEDKHINMDAIYKRKERIGGHYLNYPVLTVIMEKGTF